MFGDPRLDDAGALAFGATTISQGSSQNQQGVWKGMPGSLQLVALDGDQAPGLPLGAALDINSMSIAVNSGGRVAFRAGLLESVPAGVDQSNNAGVWSEGTGTLNLVARRGDQAPGMPAGKVFLNFGEPLISDAGHTVLVASAREGTGGTDPAGIWSDASGSLELVAAEDMPAPGVPNGYFIGFFGLSFLEVAVNGAGHVAFASRLYGSGVTNSNDTGLWVQDSSGILRLLLREGDPFEVAPGDLRTVSNIGIATNSRGSDGQRRSFGDNYQLALQLYFTDGTSGIFTAQVPVPEASIPTLVIAAFGAGLFLRKQQR